MNIIDTPIKHMALHKVNKVRMAHSNTKRNPAFSVLSEAKVWCSNDKEFVNNKRVAKELLWQQ